MLGFDPATGGRALRERIGIVLQESGFNQYLTVEEILRLHAGYYPSPRPVADVIGLVGLDEKRRSRVLTLSGGQKRRLDLALGLIGNPDLLFLDEPTTGFDPSARRSAWEILRNLRTAGTTIVLTTHYLEEAQALADRVAVIAAGRIVAQGPPAELGGRDSAATRISFLLPALCGPGDLPALAGADVRLSDGSVTVITTTPTATLRALTKWAAERGVGELPRLTVERPSLEDVYVALTTEPPS